MLGRGREGGRGECVRERKRRRKRRTTPILSLPAKLSIASISALRYISLDSVVQAGLFQFSTVLTTKEFFLMPVLAYWKARPFTHAILRVLAPALCSLFG